MQDRNRNIKPHEITSAPAADLIRNNSNLNRALRSLREEYVAVKRRIIELESLKRLIEDELDKRGS